MNLDSGLLFGPPCMVLLIGVFRISERGNPPSFPSHLYPPRCFGQFASW